MLIIHCVPRHSPQCQGFISKQNRYLFFSELKILYKVFVPIFSGHSLSKTHLFCFSLKFLFFIGSLCPLFLYSTYIHVFNYRLLIENSKSVAVAQTSQQLPAGHLHSSVPCVMQIPQPQSSTNLFSCIR